MMERAVTWSASLPLWTGLETTASFGSQYQPAVVPVSKPGLLTRLPEGGTGVGVGGRLLVLLNWLKILEKSNGCWIVPLQVVEMTLAPPGHS